MSLTWGSSYSDEVKSIQVFCSITDRYTHRWKMCVHVYESLHQQRKIPESQTVTSVDYIWATTIQSDSCSYGNAKESGVFLADTVSEFNLLMWPKLCYHLLRVSLFPPTSSPDEVPKAAFTNWAKWGPQTEVSQTLPTILFAPKPQCPIFFWNSQWKHLTWFKSFLYW